MKEIKTIDEWCRGCLFEEVIIGGKRYFRSRSDKMASETICMSCLHPKIRDLKVTKPKYYRKNPE